LNREIRAARKAKREFILEKDKRKRNGIGVGEMA
jgi:hypothetical protein